MLKYTTPEDDDEVTSTRVEAPCVDTVPSPADTDWVRVLADVETDPPPSWFHTFFRRFLGR
jgi:hypothetical protein